MRTDAREAAFKVVFANLFQDETDGGFRAAVYRNAKLTKEERDFAESLVLAVQEHREAILKQITDRVERFAENRIFPVDKAVMMVALAEISYFDDIPPVVSVSEAVSLARKYSTEKSADFVNGVLGGIINR